MTREKRGWVLVGVFQIIGFMLLAGCASTPEYSSEALKDMRAQSVSGTVTEQGNGRFFLKETATGKVHMFQTGKITQYLPEDYRSQKGDEVRVVYTKVMRRNYKNEGSPYANHAYQVHSITVAPENRMPEMPIQGTVIWVGKGAFSLNASAAFTVETSTGKQYKIHLPSSLRVRSSGGTEGLMNQKVQVLAKRISNLRFNCYHFLVEKIWKDGKVITEKVRRHQHRW